MEERNRQRYLKDRGESICYVKSETGPRRDDGEPVETLW